ncbi:MAG: DUF2490 domain-containing protein [Bacteroidota bacterium]|nr:DUF2490 domain-containing protein [Bacteroidota bacterium]MDP3146629.1 DUF2490 domain-containing protein [Bacteroidota bacterium]MDP3556202.1 DUF2490 domain-containing protein [Bacteroidota bacterium]
MSVKLLSQNSPIIIKDNMLWLGYYNTININPKWSVNSDFQFRAKNWYHANSQVLGRTGLSYKFNDKITATSGFAHFRFFINNESTRREWRPWQEILINDNLNNLKISHRFRLEQRFNEKVKNNEPVNEYQFNHRFRYRLDLRFPITKNEEKGKILYILIGNELMINAGKNITYNYFDQNRSYAGLNYELNKKISLQLQYIHIWQQLSSGNTFLMSEVIRFNLYHTIQS